MRGSSEVVESVRAIVAARGAVSLVIDDLRPEELQQISWSGSPRHIQSVGEALKRAAKGGVDYLVVRGPSGEPVAKGGVDYEDEHGPGKLWQLATHPALQSLGLGTRLIGELGPFKRGVGYEGFKKSLYAQDWFDSSTERDAANIIDGGAEVKLWLRLQRGDLPILWSSAGREYNPDFIVIEKNAAHWVLEVKMDKEMTSADVAGKREAAKRWAQHVSADPLVDVQWG